MKTKKYLLFAAISLLTISNAEIALAGTYHAQLILSLQELQAPPSVTEMSRKETEWMKKDLLLTPAQLPAIDSLNYAYAQKMADVRKNNEGDRDKRRSEMMLVHQQKRTALEKILTAEQLKQYDITLKERRQSMGNRNRN